METDKEKIPTEDTNKSVLSKIASLKNQIFDLNTKKSQIKIPRRNIAYQFQNLQSGGRNIENTIRLQKQKRRGYSSQTKTKKNKIDLLKSGIK